MKHLIKCLLTILIVFNLVVSLVSTTSDSSSNQVADDPDDEEHKKFYQSPDQSDWVDYGDMFTFDPTTKTNREPRLKEVTSNVIKRAKERKQGNGGEDWCYNDCSEISVKLRQYEAAQKQSQCDCLINDSCGTRSYQIIRRLVLLLDKQLKNRYSMGSILELKVKLDDVFFEMPGDINNSSDCDYLGNLHPLVDQILPSIVVYHPEPSIATEYLSYKTGATGVGFIMLVLFWLKMPTKLKLISLALSFFIIVTIWEYLHLYQTETAKQEEKLNRLKDKCESQASSSWFGWMATMIPDFTFRNEVSECTEYYIATRVDPLLVVNPVMAFSKVYEVTILYAMKLTANATGASFKVFFSHIPSFFVPIFIIAGVVIIIYGLKYRFMYKKATKKPKVVKQKPIAVREEEEISRYKILSPSRMKGLPKQSKSDKKTKQSKIEFPIARYASTGDIQKLCI